MSQSTYMAKLADPRWQRLRLEVMNRDSFKCRDCGSAHKTLAVHHCFYAKGNPWDTPPSLLKTLCHDCHSARQRSEDNAKRALGELFALCGPRNIRFFEKGLRFMADAASAAAKAGAPLTFTLNAKRPVEK